MKKSLVALATLAATGAVMAQATIYGRLSTAFDTWSATGATTTPATNDLNKRSRMYDNGSRFGLRINEDLGGGMRAFGNCETGINLDNASNLTQSGAVNTGVDGFCSREGHVGLGNDSVEFRMGRQNVYWGDFIQDVGANHMVFGGVGVFTAASSGFVTAPAARQENTFMLVGGKNMGAFAGSSGWYSTLNVAERGTVNPTGDGMGVTLRYATGNWLSQLDYAKITNTTGDTTLTTNRINTGLKIGGGYMYAPGSKVTVHWAQMSREFTVAATNTAALAAVNAAAATGGGSQTGTGFQIQHALGGPMTMYASIFTLADFNHTTLGSVSETGASSWAVGLRYNLSNRTHIFGSMSQVTNAQLNAVTMSGGGYSAAAAAGMSPGVDTSSTAIGILHNF